MSPALLTTYRDKVIAAKSNCEINQFAAIDTEWLALRDAFLSWLAPSNFDANGQQQTRLTDLTRLILAQRG